MERETRTLKALAMKGAMNSYLPLTTTELGELLEVSQQTASNRILKLLDDDLVVRKMGTRSQKLKLTKKGMDTLKKEYADLHTLFSSQNTVKLVGKVAAGLGEGEYYIKQDGYQRQFKTKLGFVPFQGTLNLKVKAEEAEKISLAPEKSFINIDGFKTKGRSFGTVKCLSASISDLDCAIVIPKRSHYSDVIEVLAEFQLRKTLNLKDGDVVELVVHLD